MTKPSKITFLFSGQRGCIPKSIQIAIPITNAYKLPSFVHNIICNPFNRRRFLLVVDSSISPKPIDTNNFSKQEIPRQVWYVSGEVSTEAMINPASKSRMREKSVPIFLFYQQLP